MNTNYEWTRMNANVGASRGSAMRVSDTVSLDHVKSTPLIRQRLFVFFPLP
jgi:hypothetical protein